MRDPDRHISVRQTVVFGIIFAIGTVGFHLLFRDDTGWIDVLVWTLSAVPAAVLWWWLMNRTFSNGRRTSRRS